MEVRHLDSERYLGLIILYKVMAGFTELALGIAVLTLLDKDLSELTTNLVAWLHLDIENMHVVKLVERAGMVGSGTIIAVAVMFFVFTVIAFVEAWGLHLRQRWAEWLTVIVSSSFIPLELYDALARQSLIMTTILVVNCLIVYFLVKHKELFKSRKDSLNINRDSD